MLLPIKDNALPGPSRGKIVFGVDVLAGEGSNDGMPPGSWCRSLRFSGRQPERSFNRHGDESCTLDWMKVGRFSMPLHDSGKLKAASQSRTKAVEPLCARR